MIVEVKDLKKDDVVIVSKNADLRCITILRDPVADSNKWGGYKMVKCAFKTEPKVYGSKTYDIEKNRKQMKAIEADIAEFAKLELGTNYLEHAENAEWVQTVFATIGLLLAVRPSLLEHLLLGAVRRLLVCFLPCASPFLFITLLVYQSRKALSTPYTKHLRTGDRSASSPGGGLYDGRPCAI